MSRGWHDEGPMYEIDGFLNNSPFSFGLQLAILYMIMMNN
jgi:hypothetical protein